LLSLSVFGQIKHIGNSDWAQVITTIIIDIKSSTNIKFIVFILTVIVYGCVL
jgi:hypothetical protein